jgi:hypothetical protein
MRRRTLLVALAGLAVVGAAGVVVLWPRPSSRITRENYERIRAGMSRAEIESILGPPGDYSGVHVAYTLHWRGDRMPDEWVGDDGVIAVCYSQSVACDVQFVPVEKVDFGLLGNYFWRAKRQWRRWFPE